MLSVAEKLARGCRRCQNGKSEGYGLIHFAVPSSYGVITTAPKPCPLPESLRREGRCSPCRAARDRSNRNTLSAAGQTAGTRDEHGARAAACFMERVIENANADCGQIVIGVVKLAAEAVESTM